MTTAAILTVGVLLAALSVAVRAWEVVRDRKKEKEWGCFYASGKTLDMIGEAYGVKRKLFERDSAYKRRIKAKIEWIEG